MQEALPWDGQKDLPETTQFRQSEQELRFPQSLNCTVSSIMSLQGGGARLSLEGHGGGNLAQQPRHWVL